MASYDQVNYANSARTFIVKIMTSDNEVLGYAVTERTTFVSVESAARDFPAFARSIGGLGDSFEAFREAQAKSGILAEAVVLPSRRDPGGDGVSILAPSGDGVSSLAPSGDGVSSLAPSGDGVSTLAPSGDGVSTLAPSGGGSGKND